MSDEAVLLSGVVHAMGFLVAERDASDGSFRWVGQIPEWAEDFGCSIHEPCRPDELFAFLGFFIEEAQPVWAGEGSATLRSEAWSEPARDGLEHQLEAMALRVGDRGLLAVAGVGLEFEQARSILQTARERRLKMDRELAVRQRVEQELRQRVQQRTAELDASNQQLRSLASQVALAEQRERHRLAIGLHDHIGQLLAVTKMRLSADRSNADEPDVKDRLGETIELLDDAIDSTRTLTFELSPPMLYELGLVPTLASLVEQTAKRHAPLECRFTDDQQDKPVADDVQVLLFQVVRELITNTLKHAQASRLEVKTRRDGDTLSLTVSDDGKGFDTARLNSPVIGEGGFGLLSVRERLTHFGGAVVVDSETGAGTTVRIVVPLKSS